MQALIIVSITSQLLFNSLHTSASEAFYTTSLFAFNLQHPPTTTLKISSNHLSYSLAPSTLLDHFLPTNSLHSRPLHHNIIAKTNTDNHQRSKLMLKLCEKSKSTTNIKLNTKIYRLFQTTNKLFWRLLLKPYHNLSLSSLFLGASNQFTSQKIHDLFLNHLFCYQFKRQLFTTKVFKSCAGMNGTNGDENEKIIGFNNIRKSQTLPASNHILAGD